MYTFAGGSGASTNSEVGSQKVTLVFFLGGVTYAEIAALRFLSHQEDSECEFQMLCKIKRKTNKLKNPFVKSSQKYVLTATKNWIEMRIELLLPYFRSQ